MGKLFQRNLAGNFRLRDVRSASMNQTILNKAEGKVRNAGILPVGLTFADIKVSKVYILFFRYYSKAKRKMGRMLNK